MYHAIACLTVPHYQQQQQNFDSDPKEAWHYNHMAFTRIAKILCYMVD